MISLNKTHDPASKSWLSSANEMGNDFPIQNLPFGVARRKTGNETLRLVAAIGDWVVDLPRAEATGMLSVEDEVAESLHAPSLNAFIKLGLSSWSSVRRQLFEGLLTGSRYEQEAEAFLIHMRDIDLSLPLEIVGYTDFFTSLEHATNAGTIFGRPVPVTPNFYHIPIAYNGRASSIRVSGTACRRPSGMRIVAGEDVPTFGPSNQLDYELELGVLVGRCNELGLRVSYEEAEGAIFGVCLLNDWSSRDIQKFEAQPLGPFLGKSFLTSVSPWVVTMEALAPFRVPNRVRGADEPAGPSHLVSGEISRNGALDIDLTVSISSVHMRDEGMPAHELSHNNTKWLYWNVFQMLTHHTSNGCNLSVGDIFGTGTISGTEQDKVGCLLEMTRLGETPIALPSGEERAFLEDGDEIVFRGRCYRNGAVSIGFGECRGRVLPS